MQGSPGLAQRLSPSPKRPASFDSRCSALPHGAGFFLCSISMWNVAPLVGDLKCQLATTSSHRARVSTEGLSKSDWLVRLWDSLDQQIRVGRATVNVGTALPCSGLGHTEERQLSRSSKCVSGGVCSSLLLSRNTICRVTVCESSCLNTPSPLSDGW